MTALSISQKDGPVGAFVSGIDLAESDALLALLFEHAKRPEHIYRFEWEPGSIALRDNRATWHMALNDYHGHHRLMHRITLEGVGLEGAGFEG